MSNIDPKLTTLIIGYGNPGRQDDGLGPSFIDTFSNFIALSEYEENKLNLQSNYQLTVEDALDICQYQQVIFVDASLEGESAFHVDEIKQTNDTGFGSHSLTPYALIQLCQTLYQHHPKAFIIGIRGYEFDQFEEKLSAAAEANLNQALAYLQKILRPLNSDECTPLEPHHA